MAKKTDFTKMKYISFDTETTGTEHGKDRICQIALAVYEDGVLKNGYKWDINPEIKNTQGAFDTHGLSDDYLKTQPTLKEKFYEVLDVLIQTNAHENVAYNSDFDTIMLSLEFERIYKENSRKLLNMHDYIAKNYPDFIPEKYRVYTYNPETDTYSYTGKPISELNKKSERIISFIDMFPTADLMPALVQGTLAIKKEQSGRESLDAIAGRLGVSLDKRKERHDALVDSEIAMDCYLKALETGVLQKPITDLERKFSGAELVLVKLTNELKIEPEVAKQAISFKDRQKAKELQTKLEDDIKQEVASQSPRPRM